MEQKNKYGITIGPLDFAPSPNFECVIEYLSQNYPPPPQPQKDLLNPLVPFKAKLCRNFL